jgi:hypothetical protein
LMTRSSFIFLSFIYQSSTVNIKNSLFLSSISSFFRASRKTSLMPIVRQVIVWTITNKMYIYIEMMSVSKKNHFSSSSIMKITMNFHITVSIHYLIFL